MCFNNSNSLPGIRIRQTMFVSLFDNLYMNNKSEFKFYLMKRITLLVISGLVLLYGCRKTPDFDQLSYEFFVSTNLDKTADFGSYKTFYISDTIAYISDKINSDSLLVGVEAEQLTGAVKDNMAAHGYTLVDRDDRPDLGLTLTAVKNLNVVVSAYPGWWDWWYGGCYWYYWCYGYYYPWTTVYTYTTGTVILNMYDLKNADENQQLKGIWNTVGLGALGTGTTANIQKGVDAINQGFLQSPYLKAN